MFAESLNPENEPEKPGKKAPGVFSGPKNMIPRLPGE